MAGNSAHEATTHSQDVLTVMLDCNSCCMVVLELSCSRAAWLIMIIVTCLYAFCRAFPCPAELRTISRPAGTLVPEGHSPVVLEHGVSMSQRASIAIGCRKHGMHAPQASVYCCYAGPAHAAQGHGGWLSAQSLSGGALQCSASLTAAFPMLQLTLHVRTCRLVLIAAL